MSPNTMIVLIFGLSVASLWFGMLLVYSDRRHTRLMVDKQADRAEKEAERRDRQMLLQRIQAPEQAANDFTAQTAPEPQMPQTIPFDDDAAYWRMRHGLEDTLDGAAIGIDPIIEEADE